MTDERPWFETGFDEDYPIMQTYEESVTEIQATSAELLLNLDPHSKILDLCCGYGRHSFSWREGGHNPVGLDFSPSLLALARQRQPTGTWVRGDVRRLPFAEGAFDAATFMFVSFGYFDSSAEDLDALREARRVIRPGGGLYLDIKLPATLRANQPPDATFNIKGAEITEASRIVQTPEGERYEIRRTLRHPGKPERKFFYSVRLYEPDALKNLLEEAGFSRIRLYGDYNASALEEGRPRLIALGERPHLQP
ncbi:MAG: class I SAM-dependent methyltransferase [Nitrospinaceae bacterium]|nr:class I SAM-dependent methyltransferase [Nitrospinaceae bacterium]MBT4095298.1 class I SAM-dependent methyltransferase [Nitrospinaceae bacterium]MBT5367098.1 class I SAM-dependent methyltransferase [Nitrospinaceae bacterium]MBT5948748.1 class I SAM-dependent methyltransferase [Nitrospinaceae bacterium]MBT6394394.1 class I SAM-dependent methyltransferase [Nitrospinaceae bacterium]